ncbi:MAG: hypothetical protein KBG28_10950 [Kofleriaceae bacterium]|nr:hypothetical protein [Kofleriaceae bacterium]
MRLVPFLVLAASLVAPASAAAQDVFAVCKGESQPVVAGTGKMSIAVVYPDDFPIKTTPAMRNAVGRRLALAEKAIIVPAKDVAAAKKLVDGRAWSAGGMACDLGPSMVAALGLRHPNLSTATASVECGGAGVCSLHVDLERHGRPSRERWVRYSAPLAGAKDKLPTYMKTAPKLAAGPRPNIPTAGLQVSDLPTGVVTMRSDADGALEVDRVMEGNPAFAACRPAGRKASDIRGFWAEWSLSARGLPSGVTVKPFAGRDPADEQSAKCLRRAIEATKLACPRDAKPIAVKTAICL